MKKFAPVLVALLLFVSAPAALGAGTGVRGEVLDTTCALGCEAECPPPPTCRGARVCVQVAGASIICPLTQRGGAEPLFCTQAGCPGPPFVRYPPYAGAAATVLVRRAGATKVLMRVPVNAGRFTALLGPGRYVLRAHVGEPCWTGTRAVVEVEAGRFTPAVLQVDDACVAHPDS